MRAVCAKMMPKVFTDDRKVPRKSSHVRKWSRVFKQRRYRRRTRVIEYDLETKKQPSAWHTLASSRPKKVRMGIPKSRGCSLCFFYRGGLTSWHSMPRHLARVNVIGAYFEELWCIVTKSSILFCNPLTDVTFRTNPVCVIK